MRCTFVAASFSSPQEGISEGGGPRGSRSEEKKRSVKHDLRETKERTRGARHASTSKCMHAVRRGVIYATINEQRDFA